MNEFSAAVRCYIDEILSDKVSKPLKAKGEKFSKDGPAPFSGCILNDPDMLWTEDRWDDNRLVEAKSRILEQGPIVPTYWKNRYESKAGSYWHQFYNRNSNHFYKDRHYIHIVFPELQPTSPNCEILQMLEIGCGVGNSLLPLLDINPSLVVHAIDFANSAIKILKEQPQVINSGRVHASVCCVVKDELPVPALSMDLVLCMFVLSAISPQAHEDVIHRIAKVMKPGAKLLIRDYGRYDEAELRFGKGSKLDEHFYVRQDGTCSYFFDKDELADVCARHGLAVLENEYLLRQYANREQQKARYRVWIHCKFVKL